jgi:hypothetical protein
MGYYEAITKVIYEVIFRRCIIRLRNLRARYVLLEDAP